MTTIECHFCEGQVQQSVVMWIHLLATGEKASDGSIEHISIASRKPSDGAVACCPACFETNPSPEIGDTLVVAKDHDRAAVLILADGGRWISCRDDVADVHTAWTIARAQLPKDGRVWYKHESQPDSAIRRY